MLSDLRFAVRTLVKSRGFVLVTLATLAVAIGANTAIFAGIRAVFLRPLPYPAGDRLVRIWESIGPGWRGSVSEENLLDWQAQNHSLEDMSAFRSDSFNLATGNPERVVGQYVTEPAFRLFGIAPALGRTFAADEFEVGRDRSVVLGNGLWRRNFGGDPKLVGKKIDLSGRSYTVVGVMPAGFTVPGSPAELWVPLPLEKKRGRGSHYLMVYTRLRAGVPLAQARVDLETVARGLEARYPDTNTKRTIIMELLRDHLAGDLQQTAVVLSLAVAFVLLIGCANVANLFLARASGRRGEIALRLALGASRWRLVRQLLTESLVLGLVGAGLGLLVAMWGTAALEAGTPVNTRSLFAIHLDGQVLAFAAAAGMFAALLFGLVPALHSSRIDLSEALKEGAARTTATRGRFRRGLVVAEVALSVVLLVGAGILIRSLSRLNDVKLGFDPQRLLTLEIALPEPKYTEEAASISFYERLLGEVRAVPGVVAAGAANFIPLSSNNWNGNFKVAGRPPFPRGQEPITEYILVSPDYLDTLGVRVMSGRGFTRADRQGTPYVALVNETFARQVFPKGDAVGQRLGDMLDDHEYEIVGVVADTRRWGKHRPPVSETYLPLLQKGENNMSLLVRTAGDPMAVASAVREKVRVVDSSQAVFGVRSMTDVVDQAVSLRRFETRLLSLFAALALFLAALGIYGVMAYHVSERTRELGIRMALGAGARRVRRMVLRDGMRLCLLGLVLGMAGAAATTRLLQHLVFGAGAGDLASYLGAGALLTTVALLACWIPARRATRVDPMVALRGA